MDGAFSGRREGGCAQRCGIQFVEVTCDHLYVAQLKGRHHRPRPLHRRRVEIDAHDPPAGPDHPCQDRKAADGSAPAAIAFHPGWTPSLRNAARAISALISAMLKSRRRRSIGKQSVLAVTHGLSVSSLT